MDGVFLGLALPDEDLRREGWEGNEGEGCDAIERERGRGDGCSCLSRLRAHECRLV